jgi:hypothetical protein
MVRPAEEGIHVRVTALAPLDGVGLPPGLDWPTYWNQMEYISRCLSGDPITDQVMAYSPFGNHSVAGGPEHASHSGDGPIKSIFDGVGSTDMQGEDAPKQTAATAQASMASVLPPSAAKKQSPDIAPKKRGKGLFELALLDQFAREDAEWAYEKQKKDNQKPFGSGSGCGTGFGLDDW